MLLAEKRPLLYTIPEVMHLLAVSRTTIYREMTAGRLNAVRIGGAVRIAADEVDRYIESLK